MVATTQTVRVGSRSRGKLWAGRVLTALPIAMMLLSSMMKLSHAPQMVTTWTDKLGYPESVLTGIGLLELACAILYAVPRTAVLGAILVTGYLGGAVATHVRIGDPGFVAPLVLGVLAWAGLYARDSRIANLLPIVHSDGNS